FRPAWPTGLELILPWGGGHRFYEWPRGAARQAPEGDLRQHELFGGPRCYAGSECAPPTSRSAMANTMWQARVTLASIVHEFLEGASPETIIENFGSLRLEQVYGAIAYYLGHQAPVRAHLAQRARNYETARRRQPPLSPDLRK